MSSISAVSAGIAMHAPPPANAAKVAKPDGDGDHGVEPNASAQTRSSAASPAAGGVLNRTA